MNKDEAFKKWREEVKAWKRSETSMNYCTVKCVADLVEILDALIAPESSLCHAPIINDPVSNFNDPTGMIFQLPKSEVTEDLQKAYDDLSKPTKSCQIDTNKHTIESLKDENKHSTLEKDHLAGAGKQIQDSIWPKKNETEKERCYRLSKPTMDNFSNIERGYKAYKRAGDFIQKVFTKVTKRLTAEDCQKLKDWYGIPPNCVVLMAISHGFEIDKEGFAKLLNEDDVTRKGMRPC